jgi:hypothetical protein
MKIVRNENALHPSKNKAEKKEFYTNVGININKFVAPSLYDLRKGKSVVC